MVKYGEWSTEEVKAVYDKYKWLMWIKARSFTMSKVNYSKVWETNIMAMTGCNAAPAREN